MRLPPEEQRQILVEEIEQLNIILRDQGWSVEGYNGQPRPHWALTARRQAMEALRKLDRQTAYDASEVSELEAYLAE
jgi:hypothetical protein